MPTAMPSAGLIGLTTGLARPGARLAAAAGLAAAAARLASASGLSCTTAAAGLPRPGA